MSAKFSKTTSDFIEWNQAMNLVRNLYNDKKYRISLLVATGTFGGFAHQRYFKVTMGAGIKQE